MINDKAWSTICIHTPQGQEKGKKIVEKPARRWQAQRRVKSSYIMCIIYVKAIDHEFKLPVTHSFASSSACKCVVVNRMFEVCSDNDDDGGGVQKMHCSKVLSLLLHILLLYTTSELHQQTQFLGAKLHVAKRQSLDSFCGNCVMR